MKTENENLAKCKLSAKAFNYRTEWASGDSHFYNLARINNWLDECCAHMGSKREEVTKWTYETCKAEALKYSSRSEWKAGSGRSYEVARKRGWLAEFTAHLGYDDHEYTLQDCVADASKYKTQTAWLTSNYRAYHFAKKNGWLPFCLGTSKKSGRPVKWTFDACLADAKKYKTRTEWTNASPGAITAARRKGWFDECCKHMKKSDSLKWPFKACLAEAKKYKTRTEWSEKSPGSMASAKKNGWYDECCSHMLPSKPGPEIKWSFEICHTAALNYKTRSEWYDNDRASYSAASRYGWLDACCQHMGEDINKQNLKWTFEACIDEAKKYKSFAEWRRLSYGSYNAAERKGWLDECREHLNVDGGWTFEACFEKAKEFKTRTAWQINCIKSYRVAKKHGWFESCCGHMKAKRGPSSKWTLDKCRIEASKYSSRSEWQQGSTGSYEFARMEGCLDECCKHMDTIKTWTFEECLSIAKRYKTRTEWEKKYPASVGAARKHGWYDDCCKHMRPLRGPSAAKYEEEPTETKLRNELLSIRALVNYKNDIETLVSKNNATDVEVQQWLLIYKGIEIPLEAITGITNSLR